MKFLCRIGWHRWKDHYVYRPGTRFQVLGLGWLQFSLPFKHVGCRCTRCGAVKDWV